MCLDSEEMRGELTPLHDTHDRGGAVRGWVEGMATQLWYIKQPTTQNPKYKTQNIKPEI
jgi:glycine cleavage system aminomethyltransferase T